MKKVSIVIPAHNEEASVARTIEAALAQDYPDFEIIVVDNASDDNTYEVASRYPVKVVREPKKGLLQARERGRIEASGDFIANMDADCLPDSCWLTQGVSRLTRDDIVAITGPYDYHDAGRMFRKTSLFAQKSVYKLMSMLLQSKLIGHGAVMIGGNNIIRASALEKTNGYTTSILFYGEDTDTARKIAKHGHVLFHPSLTMKTSARRFKAEGSASLALKYWYHFFKQILKPNS